jgi:hypothetical protein
LKKSKNIAALLLNSFFAIFLVFPLSLINAEESRSFSISPPNFELSAKPADVISNTLKIENLSDYPLTFTVRSQNFKAYGDEGQVSLTEETSSYSINEWINYKATTFTIAAKKNYLLDFTINIPANAEPGSHFGAIVISTSDPNAPSGSGTSVVQEIGALILIRLPGDVNEAASLLSFTPAQQIFTDPILKFNSTVENIGDVHFKMSPFIHIYDIFGNKVQSYETTPKNILPGSKRIFDEELDFQGFGYYTAKLEMFYAGGAKSVTADTSFTALYLSRSLPITILIVVLLVLYFSFKKRINKALKVLFKG